MNNDSELHLPELPEKEKTECLCAIHQDECLSCANGKHDAHCQKPSDVIYPPTDWDYQEKTDSWEKQFDLNWQDYTDTEWFYEVKEYISSHFIEKKVLQEKIKEMRVKNKISEPFRGDSFTDGIYSGYLNCLDDLLEEIKKI